MWLQTMIQSSLILLRAAGLPECAFELVGAFGATGAGLVAGSGILPLGAAHKAVDPRPAGTKRNQCTRSRGTRSLLVLYGVQEKTSAPNMLVSVSSAR